MQITNLVKIMLLLSALVVLSPSNAGAGEKGVTVGEEQSGQQLTLRVGEIFQVELPGPGGTGYSWYLDNLDSRYLELVSHEIQQASPERMVGGPLLYLWRFKAKKEGRISGLPGGAGGAAIGSPFFHFLQICRINIQVATFIQLLVFVRYGDPPVKLVGHIFEGAANDGNEPVA